MKNRLVMILIISNIIFILLWSGSSVTANRQRKLATDKAAQSMDLEDKNAKLEKEKSALALELKVVQGQFAEEKLSRESTKTELSQEQVTVKALKAELDRVTHLKETLEKDLKEALGAIKK